MGNPLDLNGKKKVFKVEFTLVLHPDIDRADASQLRRTQRVFCTVVDSTLDGAIKAVRDFLEEHRCVHDKNNDIRDWIIVDRCLDSVETIVELSDLTQDITNYRV